MQGIGFFDVGAACPDLVIENGTVKADNTLETPCLISLHSNRRVEVEDLPEDITTQEGWWGDEFSEADNDLIGSALWTLARRKVVAETAVRMEEVIEEAFQWLLDDGIADTVAVTAARSADSAIEGQAEITKPGGDNIPFKFIWDGQELKLTGAA